MKYFLFLFFIIFFVSCADTANNSTYNPGELNGSCYANQTCNDNLVCVNKKCVEDKCLDKKCEEWMECSQTTGECDHLKDGYCLKDDDCNTEANEICKDDHTCGVKTTEIENCSPDGNECSDNQINTICNEDGKCVPPEHDLCENTDCSADVNSECNSVTGNCECKSDFHLEERGNECLPNQKEVNCKKPEIQNSEYTISTTEIKWSENNGWEEIPLCEWRCKDGFYKKAKNDAQNVNDNNYVCKKCDCEEWQTCNEDGSCTLAEGRCETVGSECMSSQNNPEICDENHNCVNAQNPCEGVDCGGPDSSGEAKGECNNVNGTAVCVCKTGYFDDGSLNCINPCEGKNCSGHGHCEADNILDAHCVCNENYFADSFNCISPCTGHWNCNNDSIISDRDDHQETIHFQKINNNISSKRGTCEATSITDATCDCINGYEDPDNDLVCTSVCSGVTCSGHGTCAVVAGEASCNCNNGYAKPSNDSLECLDVDECINNLDNCDIHATCRNTLGSFTCTCNQGYEGNGINCTPADACNNSCESWESCNQSTGNCEPVTGRCNSNLDCSENDCLIRNSSSIDPVFNPDCYCDTASHYCKVNPNTCNPACGTDEECVNGHCEPVDGCNGACESWETCEHHICRAKLGNCNDDLDCSRAGSCHPQKTLSPIEPNIDPNCLCDQYYHTCKSRQVK